MSFSDVDREEVGVIFIVVVNLHHVADVAAEGRSSVAAENDDERASASAFADVEVIGAVEGYEPSVGGVITDFEVAAMHMGQGITHHTVDIFRAARHLRENEERGEQEHKKNGGCPFPEKIHDYLLRLLKDSRTLDPLRTITSAPLPLRKTANTVAKGNTLAVSG